MGKSGSENGVDEGRHRRALCEDYEGAQEQEDHDDGRKPPLLPDFQEVPELGKYGQLAHIGNSIADRSGSELFFVPFPLS